MLNLTGYKIRREIDGKAVADFDAVLDPAAEPERHGPITRAGFDAKLYINSVPPHEPGWASFLKPGFGDDMEFPVSAGVGALLVLKIRIDNVDEYFAFTFGTGRFLLRSDSYERGYGLRTVLNLVYPDVPGQTYDESRLTALDAKRRSEGLLRSRRQSSRAATFEAFDIDRMRDILTGATGRPGAANSWGFRVTGSDAMSFSSDATFDSLGQICRCIAEAHARTDYRRRFAWVDYIQMVRDPALIDSLRERVAELIRTEQVDDLDLAPPEILDWATIDGFRFHFERNFQHPELRLTDFINGLKTRDQLNEVTFPFLRTRHVTVLGGGGDATHHWMIWQCLTGEVLVDNAVYVLDEGDFYLVDRDYLTELDAEINGITETDLAFPSVARGTKEAAFNTEAAEAADRLLMDRQLVRTSAATTPIEVCDVLTADRKLVHVKRDLGSSDLSHLFAQGFVSADLLHRNRQFREAVRTKIAELDHTGTFGFISPDGLVPAQFEVVYVIVTDWRGRSFAQALPFFSKVNLRRVIADLQTHGFQVSRGGVQVT